MLHIFNITLNHIDMLYNQRNLLIICFSFKLIIIATHLLVSLVIIFFFLLELRYDPFIFCIANQFT